MGIWLTPMNDIVERLRARAREDLRYVGTGPNDKPSFVGILNEAADEIERLRNRVKELEEWEELWMVGP